MPEKKEKPAKKALLLNDNPQLAISSTNFISIYWGASSFSAVRAKSLLPSLITRKVKQSLVIDEAMRLGKDQFCVSPQPS